MTSENDRVELTPFGMERIVEPDQAIETDQAIEPTHCRCCGSTKECPCCHRCETCGGQGRLDYDAETDE